MFERGRDRERAEGDGEMEKERDRDRVRGARGSSLHAQCVCVYRRERSGWDETNGVICVFQHWLTAGSLHPSTAIHPLHAPFMNSLVIAVSH